MDHRSRKGQESAKIARPFRLKKICAALAEMDAEQTGQARERTPYGLNSVLLEKEDVLNSEQDDNCSRHHVRKKVPDHQDTPLGRMGNDDWQVSWLAGRHLRPVFPGNPSDVYWTEALRSQLRGQPRFWSQSGILTVFPFHPWGLTPSGTSTLYTDRLPGWLLSTLDLRSALIRLWVECH